MANKYSSMDIGMALYLAKKHDYSEEETLRLLAPMTTQRNISEFLGIKIRRVKYLFKKYGIRKNHSYGNWETVYCLGCKEFKPLHSEWGLDSNGRLSRFCNDECRNLYYRNRYMNRILNRKWHQRDIIQEIFDHEAEIINLKKQLDLDGLQILQKLREVDSPHLVPS